RIDWKRAWLIPVAAAALIGLPTLAGALSYSFLSVDTALAACFAFALLTADDDQPLPLLAALTGLILLKQSGALLCLLVLLYTVMGGRPREALPARQKRMLCFLLPAATYIAWMIYCRAIGATGLHTGGTFAVLGQMLSGAWAAPEGLAELPSALWDALTHAPTTGKLLTALPILPVPRLVWMLVLIVSPLLMGRAHGWKPMRRLSVFALVASALYLGTIALSFLTTFSGELGSYTGENVNNLRLLLERYLAPLLLGLGALELRCALDWRAMRGAGLGWAVSAAALTAAALCLCAGWPGMQGTLWPDGYAQREEVLPVEIKTAEPNDWYEDIEEPESAVILIGFSNDSEFIENLVYTFLPSRLVLATPGCADPAVLADVMRAEGVTHVICLDDACPLYAGATALSADESIDTYTLYVMNDEGQLEWT
ncbi:MAG: hypothetical protein PHY12_11800, partial [Eubacteriales bacterium]|nr:hypothetical protein [Eubacteriales bacterium]